MTALHIKRFSGIQPRYPESLLPEGAAALARNCDFAYGELRNTRHGFLIGSMRNIPRSIYTDNGLTFYTWPSDVDAVKAPVSSDSFNRLYFTSDSGILYMASRDGMNTGGGEPGTKYRVGVPKPTLAPVAATSMPKASPDSVSLNATFFYQVGDTRYQEGPVAMTAVDSAGRYRFTPPALIPSSTAPAGGSGSSTTSGNWRPNGTVRANYADGPICNKYRNYSIDSGVIIYYEDKLIQPNVISGYEHDGSESGSFVPQPYYRLGDTFWYGLRNDITPPTQAGSSTATEGTPEGAKPVLRLIGTSIATGEQLFDLYSDGAKSGLYSLTIAKEDGANNYIANIGVGIDEKDKESRAYVYTYANVLNEEGPPSPAASTTTAAGISVNLTLKFDNVPGYMDFKEIRVYRTQVGTSIAEYFYVGAISLIGVALGTEVTFTDSVPAELLNEPISSTEYYEPPGGIRGIIELPNGILMGWRGDELLFCEPYRPWAWPPKYQKKIKKTIVGAIAHGSGAIVTTLANPFLVSGVSSDSMTTTKLNITQAGVSKRSIVSVDGMVVYASPDGLVTINGATGSLAASERFFTRDVWRSRYGSGFSTMQFSVWDGRLIGYSSIGAFTPFMIRLDEAAGTMTDLPNLVAYAGFVSPESDQFYYTSGANLYQFNGGANQACEWKSRELFIQRPDNLGAAQAVVEGNWTVRFYADGTLRHTKELTTGTTTFRLPAGFKSDRWQVMVTGSGKFKELRLTKTPNELMRV